MQFISASNFSFCRRCVVTILLKYFSRHSSYLLRKFKLPPPLSKNKFHIPDFQFRNKNNAETCCKTTLQIQLQPLRFIESFKNEQSKLVEVRFSICRNKKLFNPSAQHKGGDDLNVVKTFFTISTLTLNYCSWILRRPWDPLQFLKTVPPFPTKNSLDPYYPYLKHRLKSMHDYVRMQITLSH